MNFILLIGTKNGEAYNTTTAIIGKIFLTLFIACLPILFSLLNALGDMCSWTTEKTLFENKYDKTSKIVLRDFGCGATDSESPTHGIFKIKYYTSHLIYITDIDTNTIDKTIWTPANIKNK